MHSSALVLLQSLITCAVFEALAIGQSCPALPGLPGRDGRDCTLPQPTQPKGLSFSNPIGSCSDVIKEDSHSSDGWYWIRDNSENDLPPRLMMCYLRGHDQCGDGVWMRIGYFDTRQPLAECPGPLIRLVVDGNSYYIRHANGCDSVFFNVLRMNYSEIWGRIVAKQYGNMNAFSRDHTVGTIDGAYAKGILITQGSPRQHAWTYAVADVANPSSGYTHDDTCLCTGHASAPQPPSFIGRDYYCDSANDAGGNAANGRLYNKELWNSQGPMCSVSSSCCENPDQPWFKKKVAAPVSDNIELRWCGDQIVEEATATQLVELYIRVN